MSNGMRIEAICILTTNTTSLGPCRWTTNTWHYLLINDDVVSNVDKRRCCIKWSNDFWSLPGWNSSIMIVMNESCISTYLSMPLAVRFLTNKTKISLEGVLNSESSIQTGKLSSKINKMIVLHNFIDDSPTRFQG